MDDICIIGIAGGTASGKTTIVNKLKDFFGNDVELISHDCYYKAHDDMPYEERAKLNYDHPSSFDTDSSVLSASSVTVSSSVGASVCGACVWLSEPLFI